MSTVNSTDFTKNKFHSSISSNLQTGAGSSFDDDIIKIRRRELTVYPIYSEISQIVTLPRVFYSTIAFFSTVQYLFSGLWANSLRFSNFYHQLEVIRCFSDFFCNVSLQNNSFATYIILLVYLALLIAWKFFIHYYYLNHRQHTKFMLYSIRICEQVILAPLIPGYAAHAGIAFRYLGNEAITTGVTAVWPILFVLSSLATILASYFFIQAYSYGCLSPILMQSATVSWDPTTIKLMVVLLAFQNFMAPVLDLFDSWITVIFIIIGIIICVYILSQLIYFPFLFNHINILFMSFSITHLVSEVLMIPVCFGVGLPEVALLPLFFVVLVITFVVSFIFMKKLKEKIFAKFSYSAIPSDKITDAAKHDYFNSLNIKTINQIYSYLRVGIMHHCQLIIDFSFSHYVIENYPTKEVLLTNAHLLSFFPTELQYFAYCLGQIHKFGKLSDSENFLYYQLKKVHLMRQSSLSKESVSTLRKIRKRTKDCTSAIRGFWKDIGNGTAKVNVDSLISVYSETKRLCGEFQDLSEKFANNQEMCNEYAEFLIDGAAKYHEAIQWKVKVRKLEQGRKIDIDYALKSFLNMYPSYLFDKVIDVHGSFIKDSEKQATNQSNSSNYSSSQSSGSFLLDQRLEETSDFIKDSRQRISVERALSSTKLPGLDDIKEALVFQLIVSLLIFIVILIILPSINLSIDDIIHELEQLNSISTCIGFAAFLSNYMLAINPTYQKFDMYNITYQLTGFPYQNIVDKETNVFKNPEAMLEAFTRNGFNGIDSLMRSIMKHPESRELIMDLMISHNNDVIYAYGLDELNSANEYSDILLQNTTIEKVTRGALFEMFLIMYRILQEYYYGDVTSNKTLNLLTSGIATVINFVDPIEQMQSSIMEVGSNYARSVFTMFRTLMIVIPIIFFAIFIFLQIRALITLYKKTHSAINILTKVKPEAIEDSLEAISISKKDKKINTSVSQLRIKRSYATLLLPFFIVLIVIISSLMIFLVFYIGSNSIEDINLLFQWFTLASFRFASIYHCLAAVTHLSFDNSSIYYDFLHTSYNRLLERHSALLGGNPNFTRMIGFNENVDNKHFLEVCSDVPTSFYQYYLCLSTDRSINQILIFVKDLIDMYDLTDNYTLNTASYCNLLILVDFKMTDQLFDFHNTLSAYSEIQFSQTSYIMQILCIVFLLLSALFIILAFYLIASFDHALEGMKQLIRLLPPQMVLKNEEIIQFIVGQSTESNEYLLTTAQSIILESSNGSISVSLDHTINSVNNAFCSMTGFAPTEVLGQPLTMLFPFTPGSSSSASDDNADVSRLYQTLDTLKNNITDVSERLNMKCMNDHGEPLSVQLTLIAVQDESRKTESFVIIMKDMVSLKKQQKGVKDEKRRSEKLMENLLPSHIYEIISKREPDASTLFVTTGGTIIMTQIIGLVDSVNTISPTQLISVLGNILDTFQSVASKYPAVHTLPSSDDILIACCGVFDFIDQPKDQVSQAVMFATEFHSLIDEINEQNDVLFHFRTGISFGGPLVGNVLSLEIPAFDLFGEMIIPASNFAKYGQEGTVQITQSVKNLLDPAEFQIQNGKKIKNDFQSYIVTDITLRE